MAAKTAMRATTTFHAPGRVTISEGDVLAGDDPLVKKYGNLFVPADQLSDRPVETARTRPGEARTTTATKRTAKPKD